MTSRIVVGFQCRVFDAHGDGDGYKQDSWLAATEERAWELYREMSEALESEESAREWYGDSAPFSDPDGFLCRVDPPCREYLAPRKPLPVPDGTAIRALPDWVQGACDG